MKAMVCPDIMNVIRERKTTNLETEFQPFARKYNTYQIKHWSGMTLSYNSSQLKSGCSFIKGAVLSPNCIEVCASKISIRVTVGESAWNLFNYVYLNFVNRNWWKHWFVWWTHVRLQTPSVNYKKAHFLVLWSWKTFYLGNETVILLCYHLNSTI